ncbi:MAG: protein-L-isoaspartate(D-aspartate) O-methyltransferase [Alphaproteobacteria bacterium]|nr:protein-L-isoaspartate(D-aspartate) O-methyltransferase [Alphaproteobacteria bacterium]
MVSSAALRSFYAKLVAGNGQVDDPRIVAAFAAVPRERFVGPGPWQVYAQGGGYIETPSDDPIFIYQDVLVGLASDRGLNNGQPSLHVRCLAALQPRAGETAVHIGAGTGYYTALLAELVGPTGSVVGYEVESDLARRAAVNLSSLTNVTVHHRSACEGPIETCDVIYVNAGATHPLDTWLDALRPGGRLLLPLTPDQGMGGMLLLTRREDSFAARFVCPAMFVPCVGARDPATAQRLATAFARGDARTVQSLRRGPSPDQSCWCAGHGWWLSTAA